MFSKHVVIILLVVLLHPKNVNCTSNSNLVPNADFWANVRKGQAANPLSYTREDLDTDREPTTNERTNHRQLERTSVITQTDNRRIENISNNSLTIRPLQYTIPNTTQTNNFVQPAILVKPSKVPEYTIFMIVQILCIFIASLTIIYFIKLKHASNTLKLLLVFNSRMFRFNIYILIFFISRVQ